MTLAWDDPGDRSISGERTLRPDRSADPSKKANSVGELIGQPNLLPKVIHLVAKRIRSYLGAIDSVYPYVHTYDQTQLQKGRPTHIPKETT